MNSKFAILIVSPIVLTISIALLGVGVNLIGRAAGSMGSSTSAAPIVVAAVFLWLLHAGYLLGPWLYLAQRHVLAVGLMMPIAFVGLACAAFVFLRVILPNAEANEGKLQFFGLIGIVAVPLAYITPIVVHLLECRTPR